MSVEGLTQSNLSAVLFNRLSELSNQQFKRLRGMNGAQSLDVRP